MITSLDCSVRNSMTTELALLKRTASLKVLAVTVLGLSSWGCSNTMIKDERVERAYDVADSIETQNLALRPEKPRTLKGVVTLNELLALAKKNNASLMRAGYSSLIVRAQGFEAAANILGPRVSGQAVYYARSNTPATVANFGGMRSRIPTGQKTQSNLGFTLRQPVFSVADHIFRIQSARIQTKASKLRFRRAWQEVRRSVLQTAMDVLDLQSQLKSAKALLKSLKDRGRQTRDLVEAEMAIKTDIFKIEAEIANQEQVRIELTNAIRTTRVLLNTLVGADPNSIYVLRWQAPRTMTKQSPSIESAYRTAMESRPDVLALELNKKSFHKLVQTEWTSYLPRLDFQAEYNYSDARQLLEDDFFAYSIIGSIDLIDFSRHARIEQYKSQIGEISAQGLELQRQIRFQVEQSIRAIRNELSRYKQASLAEKASSRNLNDERDRFSEGLSTTNDVLEAEFGLIRDQVNRRRARFQYYKALAELDAVVGVAGYTFKLPRVGSP